MIEQLYESNNALMKQRSMQLAIEIICPVYADIISEGNQSKEFNSAHPLADIQFLMAGMQTLFDLSNIKGSTIQIDVEAVVNAMFRILKIDETKHSKEQTLKKIIEGIGAQ